jgi:Rrf2 family protein
MQIKRETDYAIRCVYYLAGKEQDMVLMDEVAKEMVIPRSFAAKILQKLVHAGIVESFQGIKGGFRLARKSNEITLYDVLQAIEGPLTLNLCTEDAMACDLSQTCKVHPFWVSVRGQVEDILRRITFAAMRTL